MSEFGLLEWAIVVSKFSMFIFSYIYLFLNKSSKVIASFCLALSVYAVSGGIYHNQYGMLALLGGAILFNIVFFGFFWLINRT